MKLITHKMQPQKLRDKHYIRLEKGQGTGTHFLLPVEFVVASAFNTATIYRKSK